MSEQVKIERRTYPIGKFGRPDKKRRPLTARRDSLRKLEDLKWQALRDLQYLEDKIRNEELTPEERKMVDDQVAEARRYLAQYADYLKLLRTTPYRDARPKKKQREAAYETPELYEGRS